MEKKDIRFYSRLKKDQLEKVKKFAKKMKVSWAEAVRILIDKYL